MDLKSTSCEVGRWIYTVFSPSKPFLSQRRTQAGFIVLGNHPQAFPVWGGGQWNGSATHRLWWSCCKEWILRKIWTSPLLILLTLSPHNLLASDPSQPPLCSLMSFCLKWWCLPCPFLSSLLFEFYNPTQSPLQGHMFYMFLKIWKWSLPYLTFSDTLNKTQSPTTICLGLVITLLC